MVFTEDFFSTNNNNLDDVVQLVDSHTKENVNYVKYTGSAMLNDDGVINRAKGNVFYQRQFDGIVNVKWYGAKGDGTTDDTLQIQRAVDVCSELGLKLYIPAQNYLVSKIRLKRGLPAFFSDGAELIANSSNVEAIIEGSGDFFNSSPLTCSIYGFELNCNQLAKRGIFIATANNCEIYNNRIFNLNNYDNNFLDSGICLHYSSSFNKIYKNTIELPINLNVVGVYLISNTFDNTSGWLTSGNIINSTQLNFNNIIEDNIIKNGSHGISVYGSNSNTIIKNTLSGQRDRAIILSPHSENNIVSHNRCLDFGSSGIHLAYGSNYNIISENIVESLISNGEGGIQAYISCIGNKIVNNKIVCSSNYGIYLGVDVKNNEVKSNLIKGTVKRALIALESTWQEILDNEAIYSRPNYGAPGGRSDWANGDSFENIIEDNILYDCNIAVCGIYLAQLKNKGLYNNHINGNKITGETPRHYLYVFQKTIGKNNGNYLSQNKFDINNLDKIFFSQGRSHFKEVKDNSVLNDYDFYDLPPQTINIDVSKVDCISTATYYSLTEVENFIGGIEGQEIVIRMSVFTKFSVLGNIKPISINFSADANDISIFRLIRGYWREIYRSYN